MGNFIGRGEQRFSEPFMPVEMPNPGRVVGDQQILNHPTIEPFGGVRRKMFVFQHHPAQIGSILKTDKIILGIDPGTTVMGYGLIRVKGKNAQVMTLGVLELKKYTDHYLKLQKIFERMIQLIDSYQPDELAIEAPFFGKNVQSMLKLGRAQGVAMAAALSRNMPVFEYAPLRIKQAITGHGNASKEQVATMLQRIMKFDDMPKYMDVTDGLAAAYCHFLQNQKITAIETPVKSWKEFIQKNPGRVK